MSNTIHLKGWPFDLAAVLILPLLMLLLQLMHHNGQFPVKIQGMSAQN